MGAWGYGMQANDSALDAIGEHENDLVKGLSKNIDKWMKSKENYSNYILGLSEAIIDKKLELSSSVKKKVIKTIKKELLKKNLDNWVDTKQRISALKRFHNRLLGKRVNKKALEKDNEGLLSKIFGS